MATIKEKQLEQTVETLEGIIKQKNEEIHRLANLVNKNAMFDTDDIFSADSYVKDLNERSHIEELENKVEELTLELAKYK